MTDVRFVPVWEAEDPAIERDILEFWASLQALPPEEDPAVRLEQVYAVVYAGDELVAVGSAQLSEYPPLRHRFAFLRTLVHPEFGGRDIAKGLIECAKTIFCEWGFKHPELALAGVGAIYETPLKLSKPIERVGLILVGYTDRGKQVRIDWFDHIRLNSGT